MLMPLLISLCSAKFDIKNSIDFNYLLRPYSRRSNYYNGFLMSAPSYVPVGTFAPPTWFRSAHAEEAQRRPSGQMRPHTLRFDPPEHRIVGADSRVVGEHVAHAAIDAHRRRCCSKAFSISLKRSAANHGSKIAAIASRAS